MHLRKVALSALFLLLYLGLEAQVFVRSDATGVNDGSSWADAYTDLQTALSNTNDGAIWVATGTYFPTTCNGDCTTADREQAFLLPPDVQLYGGFAGDELTLEERDIEGNPTILSGDTGQRGDSLDNTFRVVIARNATESTLLDGFIIEEGNANGSFGFSLGGGILIDASDNGTGHLKVRNCTIRNNYAGGGGGMAMEGILGGAIGAEIRDCLFEGNTASLAVVSTGAAVIMLGNSGVQLRPRFVNCTFRDNYCGNDGGALSATPTGAGSLLAFTVDSCRFEQNRSEDRGGAIWYRVNASAESAVNIRNSTFVQNQAGGQGGAIFARSSFDAVANDTLLNCIFRENQTDGSSTLNDGEGGAVFLRGTQEGIRKHWLINCVFDRNRASHGGGALATTSAFSAAGICTATLLNCTFSRNRSDSTGGAIHLEGTEGENRLDLLNSIFWQDSVGSRAEEISFNGATITARANHLAGGLPEGITDSGDNRDEDPQFADPAGGDFRLLACSSAVNTGDNSLLLSAGDRDPDGDPRIHAGRVDRGAYEIGIRYVDQAASGANTGYSWENAFTEARAGFAAIRAGDQLWVARGTYLPVGCANCAEVDREQAFLLPRHTEVYGGFSGSETSLEERDWEANPTILSGDIGLPGDSLDNTYRVVIARNTSDKTILDGLVIEEGNANGSFGFSLGGGILIDASDKGTGHLKIRNCNIRNNYAGGGGGMAMEGILGGEIKAEIRDCTFEGNTASLAVVSTGAAVIMLGNSGVQIRPRFVNCSFRNNYCGNDGGAISATPTGAGSLLAFAVDSCSFEQNRAEDRGGAIWYRVNADARSAVMIRNSSFTGNRAGGQAGAVYARSSFGATAQDTILNCTFIRNQTDGSSTINQGEGGAIFLRGSQEGIREHLILNSLFIENQASERGAAIGTTSNFSAAGSLSAKILHCTFWGNRTPAGQGIIHANGSQGENNTQITNSIFWQNSVPDSNAVWVSEGARLSLGHSILETALSGELIDEGENLLADPQLIDPEIRDFRISACSPARDAGLNSALPPDRLDLDGDGDLSELIPFDQGGNNRIFGERVDIGALEWNGDPPELQLDFSVQDVTCGGQADASIRLSLSGGTPDYRLNWSTGDTDTLLENLTSGTYYLTVTDAANCQIQDSVSITEGSDLSFTVSSDREVCAGTQLSLLAQATDVNTNLQFIWTPGDIRGSTLIIEPDTTTLYRLQVTNAQGTCTATDSVLVSVRERPIPEIMGDLLICPDDSTRLSVNEYERYAWNTGEQSASIQVNEAGLYALRVSDSLGCTGVDTVIVEALSPPVLALTEAPTICAGEQLTLQPIGDFVTYRWSDNSSEDRLLVQEAGDYGLSVVDANGCRGDTTFTVGTSEVPEPNITGPDQFCPGGSVTLQAGNFSTYQWSTGDTTASLTVTQAGEYQVTVSNAEGCIAMDSITIRSPELIPAVVEADRQVCDTMVDVAANLPEGSTGLWTSESGLNIAEPTAAMTIVSNLSSGPNQLTWTLSTETCPDYSRDSIEINLPEVPRANDDRYLLSVDQDRIQEYDLLANDQLPVASDRTISLIAEPELGSLQLSETGVATFEAPTSAFGEASFRYQLCSTSCPTRCSEAGVIIEIAFADTSDELPNGITPNGDGRNDELIFDAILENDSEDLPDNRLLVFNRWGDIVYEAQPYVNNWRGTNQQGLDLPSGTYYYILYLNVSEGVILKGDITIIR